MTNSIINALNKGEIVRFNSIEPRYYCMVGTQLMYSDDKTNVSGWKKSNLKASQINDNTFKEKDFTII